MSISVQTVKINPSVNSAKSVDDLHEIKQMKHVHKPSFGKTPIILDDKGKITKFISWSGDEFNSAMQRLTMGIAAILIQPFIDLNNKKVDEKTRKTSTARTTAKIIAGTTTGVLIRQGCINLIEKFTQNKEVLDYENAKAASKGKPLKEIPKKFSKLQQWLLPKEFKVEEIKKYRNLIGTLVGLGVMCFTNFLIDAPLTMFLTNVFTGKNKEGGK